MASSALPFLMFQGQVAEAAMNFYVSQFADGRIVDLTRYGPGQHGPEGSVLKATFTVAGLTVMCIDSPVKHEFDFTPAFSLFIHCDSEDELRRLAGTLGEGGKVYMPVDNYGFSKLFAWVGDRYGVSWQLNLP